MRVIPLLLAILLVSAAAPARAGDFSQQIEIPSAFQTQSMFSHSGSPIDTVGSWPWSDGSYGHGTGAFAAHYAGALASWEVSAQVQGGLILRPVNCASGFATAPEFELGGVAAGVDVPMLVKLVAVSTTANTAISSLSGVAYRLMLGHGAIGDSVEYGGEAPDVRQDTLVVPMTLHGPGPFSLRLVVHADAGRAIAGAISGRIQAHLEFVGLPVGATITNAHGYLDDQPNPLAVGPVEPARSSVRAARAWPRGEAVDVRLTLAGPGEGRLELFDLAGRRLASRSTSDLAAGEHSLTLVPETPLAAGVHFVALRQQGARSVRRVAFVP